MQVKSQEGVVGDEDNLSEKLLIRVFFFIPFSFFLMISQLIWLHC